MNSSREYLFLDSRATPTNGELSVRIIGAPRWCDEDLARCAASEGHAAALRIAYEQQGIQCLDKLRGDFALAVHDHRNDRFLAATDRLGRYPLYYRVDDTQLTVSSEIEQLQQNEPATLSSQGLYNYVYFHMIPAPGSFSDAIEKLEMATALVWEKQQVTLKQYWVPHFSHNTGSATAANLSQRLRDELRQAVERRLENPATTGAFLSGGLDSSTVVGMLAECVGSDAQAFAIGFDAPGYDEMPYARLTAKHFGVKLHEYYVTPEDIVAALPTLVAGCGEPFGNSSMLPAFFCSRMARQHGITHLLAGDGGDELFAGNERYAKQTVFEHYARIPAAIRRGLLEPVIKRAPKMLPLIDKARSYIAQANVPLPDRLHTYNFLHQHAPEELFTPGFLSEVNTDEPATLLRDVYHRPPLASTLDRLLYLDWQFTLADNDLRKVRQACDHVGVDVSFPMLDDQLVELSLEVPDTLKMKRSRLRHFYKESLRNWLPDATIAKTKQGFGLPFGVWMQTHQPLKELALDNLVALRKRHWFRPDFIDRAIELHQTGHASYYGELIWILMVLELWLQSKERTGTDQVQVCG